MVLEEKTPDLLALLTAHVGDNTPTVPVVPYLPTPALTRTPFDDVTEKKRKRGKGLEGTEEGEIIHPAQQPLAKGSKVTRAQQKKSTSSGSSKGAKGEQRTKASIWNLDFVLSSRDPVMDDATLRDP